MTEPRLNRTEKLLLKVAYPDGLGPFLSHARVRSANSLVNKGLMTATETGYELTLAGLDVVERQSLVGYGERRLQRERVAALRARLAMSESP